MKFTKLLNKSILYYRKKNNKVLFQYSALLLTCVLIGLWLAFNFPIAFDEAKAFLVMKKVTLGREVGLNVHGGSNSPLFYQIYSWVSQITGHKIEYLRCFNIILQSSALLTFLKTFKQKVLATTNTKVFFFLFVLFFILNPFILAHTIPVDHFSLSLSLIIFSVSFFINYYFEKNEKRKSLYIFLTGLFICLSLYIRPHMGLLIFFPIFFILLRGSFPTKIKHLSWFIFSLILIIFILDFDVFKSIATQKNVSIVMSRFFLNHRITTLQNTLSLYVQNLDNSNSFFTLLKAMFTFPKVNKGTNQEAFNSLLPLSYYIKSFIHQSAGFNVSPMFIFIFGSYALLFIKEFKINSKVKKISLLCLGTFSLNSVALFFIRYLESSSFSYFYQAFFFLSLGASLVLYQFIIDIEKNDLRSKVLSIVLLLIFLQSTFLHRPRRKMNNPYAFAFRGEGFTPNENKFSPYNLEVVSKIANKYLKKDSLILLGHYGYVPYIKGKTIDGLEVNIYKNFFKKEHWGKDGSTNERNSLGTTAHSVFKSFLITQKVKVIISDGYVHKDLINYLLKNNLYHVAEHHNKVKILIPSKSECCEKG